MNEEQALQSFHADGLALFGGEQDRADLLRLTDIPYKPFPKDPVTLPSGEVWTRVRYKQFVRDFMAFTREQRWSKFYEVRMRARLMAGWYLRARVDDLQARDTLNDQQRFRVRLLKAQLKVIGEEQAADFAKQA